MIKRNISRQLLDDLADTPVLLLNGARQTGKSVLVETLTEHAHPARYISVNNTAI